MERLDIQLKTPLLPHQINQASLLCRRRASLFVEKTGKGKTLTTLAVFTNLYRRDKLDVCLALTPKGAYDSAVWKKEVSKHTNVTSIDLEELDKKAGLNKDRVLKYLAMYPVVYCKHTHVKVLSELIQMIIKESRVIVVIDEVHRLKNPKSTLTLYSRVVLKGFEAIMGITATPLAKNLEDCYNIVNFIKPWFLGTFDTFKKDYCLTEKKVIGRLPGGAGLKTVEVIVGVTSEEALQIKLESLVVKGANEVIPKFNYHDYDMQQNELSIYRKLASGLFASEDVTPEEWFKKVMSGEMREVPAPRVGEVARHSSRFLYMQFAADGIIRSNGDISNAEGDKAEKAIRLLKHIYSKGESAIMYFDYYATLDAMESLVKERGLKFKILRSTGETSMKENSISAGAVKSTPHLILATKAGSESASYWFMNHVILFHIPTTPETFTQIVGRITRINTLFPEDLNVHIFRSNNIDMYKLAVVCNKAAQMELVTGLEENIPEYYKDEFRDANQVQLCKKYLLWRR